MWFSEKNHLPCELPSASWLALFLCVLLFWLVSQYFLSINLLSKSLTSSAEVPKTFCCSYEVVGRSFFHPNLGGAGELGDGIEYWKGFYQSLRPTQMGLSLNIGTSLLENWFFFCMNLNWLSLSFFRFYLILCFLQILLCLFSFLHVQMCQLEHFMNPS